MVAELETEPPAQAPVERTRFDRGPARHHREGSPEPAWGRELGKKLCDGVSPDLLSKKPDLYPEGLSPRSMAQYLREIY